MTYDIPAHVKAHGCYGRVDVELVEWDPHEPPEPEVTCADCDKTIHPIDRASESEAPQPCGCVYDGGRLPGQPCEKARWHTGPHRASHGDGYVEWA